jgi:hypothetical protein
MPLHRFSSPVYLATPNAGERFAVFDVERAAAFLIVERGMATNRRGDARWFVHGGDQGEASTADARLALPGQAERFSSKLLRRRL